MNSHLHFYSRRISSLGSIILTGVIVFFCLPVEAGVKGHHEPSFTATLDAFWHNNPLDRPEFSELRGRVLKAARLPQLYVGYDHAFRAAQGITVTDNISVTSSAVNVGPQDNNYDYDENLGKTFRVRAVWKLDELIYRRDLLAIEKDQREIFRIKQAIAKDLFKTYQARLQLKPLCDRSIKANTTPKCSQFRALTSYLDTLTGGLFSH